MWMKHKLCVVRLVRFASASLIIVAPGAVAEDLEPRSYANTPVGINFLLMGYSDLHGSVTANPSVPLQNAKLNIKTVVLAFARSLDVWGRSGKFDIVVPEARLTGSALFAGEPKERNVTGLIDPRFRFSVNLYGAPALSLAEFPSYQQDVIIGASLAITAPLGQYDASKLVNLGNNRWSFKPELGISKRLGPVTLELSGAGTFTPTMTSSSATTNFPRTRFIRYRGILSMPLATVFGLRWIRPTSLEGVAQSMGSVTTIIRKTHVTDAPSRCR